LIDSTQQVLVVISPVEAQVSILRPQISNVDKLMISIADSQFLMRKGLRQVVESQRPEYKISGEFSDEKALLDHVMKDPPDVLILDYNQPRHFTPKTVEKVMDLSPAIGILVISADDQKQRIYEVLQAGITCFITKECDETEVLDGIEAARTGGKYFCNKVLDYLLEKSFGANIEDCAPTSLTPREREIVVLTAQGLIAKEIAHQLDLSTHTVYTHKKNIMKKLNFSSPVQLAVYAIEHGMIKG
jgi:DNA-binding NarL/FixJ family response regulator